MLISYPPSQSGEQPVSIESRESVQLMECSDHGVERWGVHEVEVDQVVDAHRLQLQQSRRQIGTLDFRHWSRQHFISELHYNI